MSNSRQIQVCGPKDEVPEGALKLSVASRAPVFNPDGWKDLWLLSPFSVVKSGVAVPGLAGVRSQTVENAWQFLKVWQDERGWQESEAMEAFRSSCAIRFPRGRGKKAIGSYWGEDGGVISYVEARRRIYAPCYLEMLERKDRAVLIERLRNAASQQPIYVWDFDSYDITRCGMTHISEAIEYEPRPFAHAFIVALVVNGDMDSITLVSKNDDT